MLTTAYSLIGGSRPSTSASPHMHAGPRREADPVAREARACLSSVPPVESKAVWFSHSLVLEASEMRALIA